MSKKYIYEFRVGDTARFNETCVISFSEISSENEDTYGTKFGKIEKDRLGIWETTSTRKKGAKVCSMFVRIEANNDDEAKGLIQDAMGTLGYLLCEGLRDASQNIIEKK